MPVAARFSWGWLALPVAIACVACEGNVSKGTPDGAVADGALPDGAVADAKPDGPVLLPDASPCTAPGVFATPETSGFPNRTPEFPRVIDADQMGGLVSDSKLYAYAYGPAIMKEGARTHMYVCSPGIVGNTWDHIRYQYTDDDGAHWSSPQVVLTSTHTNFTGQDYSACDPSIVFQNGYYYLFYSGAENFAGPVSSGSDPSEAVRTVIRVARSSSPAGPFAKYTTRHTWEEGAIDPLALISPTSFTKGQYGVGQQSVVVSGGNIYMWYLDDTGGTGNVIKLRLAPTPEEFNYHYIEFDTDNGIVALDVRYDPRSKRFISLGVPTYMNIAAIIFSTSEDGITWTKYPAEVVESEQMRHYARVEGGFTGDSSGHVVTGKTLIGFAAPHLVNGAVPTDEQALAAAAKGPYWDLFTLSVPDLSSRMFRVCE